MGQSQVGAGGMATVPMDNAAQAAALLRQAFVAMQGGMASQAPGHDGNAVEANKTTSNEEMAASVSRETPSADKPLSWAQGAMKGSGKAPYCYRCYTKGHKMECKVEFFCEICDCKEHTMERCPIYRSAQPDTKKATAFVMPCGYAVEGLGFYYINQPENFRNKVESKTAVIRVTRGTLTSANVASELERLFPGGWRWNVEETGVNIFRTVFRSRASGAAANDGVGSFTHQIPRYHAEI